MRLVHARIVCQACGEAMSATIPAHILQTKAVCYVCGRRRVLAVNGTTAWPIPMDSSIAQDWFFDVALGSIQESGFASGGQWGRA